MSHIRSIMVSHRTRTVIVLGVAIVLQFGVPLKQLWAPHPARWGWQMYTTLPTTPTFAVLLENGTTQRVDPAKYVGYMRVEIDLPTTLPPHLCRTFPDAVAVQMQYPSRMKEYPCR